MNLKLYRFLARRTGAEFNKVVLKRLYLSKANKPPVSVARIAKLMKGKDNKIAVIVGTVTDDKRIQSLPKLTVCALRFTEAARASILKNGGKVLTFDQLALQRPTGANTVLLRGKKTAREAVRHFGAAGVPHSTTKYVFFLPTLLFYLLLYCINFFNLIIMMIAYHEGPTLHQREESLNVQEVEELAEDSR